MPNKKLGEASSVCARSAIEDEAALWRAADLLLTFLSATGRKNALIEIANEIDVVRDHMPYDLFTPDRRPG